MSAGCSWPIDRLIAKMADGGDIHCHRLRRHDGEVLGRREMRQSEGVPQHDVFVVEVCVWVRGDPGGDALGGLAGGLGDVAAGGVELAVFVWRVGVSVALLRRMVSS